MDYTKLIQEYTGNKSARWVAERENGWHEFALTFATGYALIRNNVVIAVEMD